MKVKVQTLTPAQCLANALKGDASDESKSLASYGSGRSTQWAAYAHPDEEKAEWLGFEGTPPRDSKAAVLKELHEGWPKGAAMLSKVAAEVTAQIPTSRRLKVENNHVSGFDPNVGDLLDGQPFAFRRWGSRPKQQIIRLVMSTSAPGYSEPNELVWSGAVTMVLADLYTEAGYAVELFAADFVTNERGTGQLLTLVPVKEAHEQLLPDMLASVLVSPRFYRVGLIPQGWANHEELGAFGTGAGRVETCGMKTLEAHAPEMLPAVCLARVYSKQDAVNQINQTIDRVSGKEPS